MISRRPARWGSSAIWVVACVGACTSAAPDDDDTLGGVQRGRSVSDAGTDASRDAVRDAASDALVAGDPTLRRAPRVGCTTPVGNDAIQAAFPGWAPFQFLGVDAAGVALAPSFEQTRCDDLYSLALDYADAQARRGSEPAVGFARAAALTGNFTLRLVVEAVTKPSEDEESFLGILLVSTIRDDAGTLLSGLGLGIGHRTETGELVLRRTRYLPTGDQILDPTSLGTPTLPCRIEWAVERGSSPTSLQSRITLTDASSQRTTLSVDDAPAAEVALTFGLNRINPGARSRFTFSELSLP